MLYHISCEFIILIRIELDLMVHIVRDSELHDKFQKKTIKDSFKFTNPHCLNLKKLIIELRALSSL